VDLADRADAWSHQLAADGEGAAARDKLRHSPPEYRTPPGWDGAGENVAWAYGSEGPPANQLHTQWMGSQPHRDNILTPGYAAVGIGVACVGGEVYATQVFGILWANNGHDLGRTTTPADPVARPDRTAGTRCADPVDAPSEPAPTWGQTSAPPVDLVRLAGANRFATAAASILDRTPARLVIASGADWPDAVAAAPVAGRDGHVLLVERDRVPHETAAALQTIAPGQLFVMGGRAAVSDQVVGQVEQLVGRSATRIAGSTRTQTAAAAAAYVDGGPPTIADAGGVFDALVAASAGRGAVLLADPATGLPDAALAHVEAVGAAMLVGQVVADATTRAQLADAGVVTTQVDPARSDRLSATVAAVGGGHRPDVVIASGASWPDSLTAGALAHREGIPLLLAMPDGSTDWDVVGDLGIVRARVVGGTAALPDAALPR
jgi:hypothetical protein